MRSGELADDARPEELNTLPLTAPFSLLHWHCQRSLPAHIEKLPCATRMRGKFVLVCERFCGAVMLPCVVLQIEIPWVLRFRTVHAVAVVPAPLRFNVTTLLRVMSLPTLFLTTPRMN